MQTAAWILFALPFAVFLGYPVLVLAAAALRPARQAPVGSPDRLSITILICAHNEAATLGAKLASVTRALAAWQREADLLVVDDGSTDNTVAIARMGGARVIEVPRGGKAAALNRAMSHARGEVLVMTDADPLFDTETLPALLAPFADPAVGAVAGRIETLCPPSSRFAGADRLFRTYESRLRAAEDKLFGCVSADGGLYAIRRALVPHVVADATDDFFISTNAVAAGYRIAFADNARAWEHSIAGGRQQFRRRVRITVRGLTGLWRRRALMNPRRFGWYAPALILHKVARRLVPLMIVPLWLVTALLTLDGNTWWALVFAAMSIATLIALAGAFGVRLPRALRLVHGAMLHLAGLAAGTVLFFTGRRYAQWTPQKDAI